jgi:voltage-gated potassium channel
MVLLVIPLITAHFASRLIVDDDAFEHAEQEELKADVRRLRALVEEMAARQGIEVPEPARPEPASPVPAWERRRRRRRTR